LTGCLVGETRCRDAKGRGAQADDAERPNRKWRRNFPGPSPWGDEEMSYVTEAFGAADTWAVGQRTYEATVPWWDRRARWLGRRGLLIGRPRGGGRPE
jgi:hypothetical protein